MVAGSAGLLPADPRLPNDVTALLSLIASIACFLAVFVVGGACAFAVGQRGRELALLRAVGATPRQIRRLVTGETLIVVGAAASVVGCALAVPAAALLVRQLGTIGLSHPGITPGGSAVALGAVFAIGLLVARVAVRPAARRGPAGPGRSRRCAAWRGDRGPGDDRRPHPPGLTSSFHRGDTGGVTMVLTRSQINTLVDTDDVIALLREGFRDLTAAPAPPRVRTDLPGPGTATCLMPARDDLRASVYAPVGLPWQDLALLWWLHQRVTATHVTTIDLLS